MPSCGGESERVIRLSCRKPDTTADGYGLRIEVPDRDAALAWAEQCPGAQYGFIEVRPSAIVFRDGKWQPPS